MHVKVEKWQRGNDAGPRARTDRTMTYVEYTRRQPSLPSAPHPWVYLCLPASKYLEYAKRVFDTPAEAAYLSPRFSVWETQQHQTPADADTE
jgi:hypothetical protein